MLEDGAEFEKMKLRFYSKNYRGVHMSRPCKKGETILFVPLKEIITLEMCMSCPTGAKMFQRGFRQRLISPKHSFLNLFDGRKTQGKFLLGQIHRHFAQIFRSISYLLQRRRNGVARTHAYGAHG
jgi:hypothetical protein